MRRKWFGASVLLLAGCAHPGMGAGTIALQDTSGIQVSGEGEAEARPDVAIVRVGIEVRRPTVAEAREHAAQAATRMIAALRAAGVSEERTRTTSLSLHPEYEHTEQGRNLLGYTARNTLEARVTDIDRASEVVDAAVTAGGDAARLEGIELELEDPTAARAEARRQAMARARATAEQLAQLAGVELGEAVSIDESGEMPPPRPYPMAMRMEAADAMTSTPIEPGRTRVRVQVRVRYSIR